MTKKIHKLFFVWDFDKEEQWINDMSAMGMQLIEIGFCTYVFEDGLPGEYVYRLELLEKRASSKSSMDYIEFLKDTGIEFVGSWYRWVYLRKKASDTPFELFSDIDSIIKHINTILCLILPLCLLNLTIGILNVFMGFLTNKFIGSVNIILGVASLLGYHTIYMKKCKLRQERSLHE